MPSDVFVEYAASGRSTCKAPGCREKIEKNEIRIGDRHAASGFRFGGAKRPPAYQQTDFFHFRCVPGWIRNLDASQIKGMNLLRPQDRSIFQNLIKSNSLETKKGPSSAPGNEDYSQLQNGQAEHDESRSFAIPDVEIADEILSKNSHIPQQLVQKLMPFQRQGVAHAISLCKGRVLIADEMGLGKTVQAICFLKAYENEWPALIVAPSSVKLNWADELEKWLPDLDPSMINIVRDRSFPGDLDASITIVTYGMFTQASKVCKLIADRKFKVVVLDESHYIKSYSAARTKLLTPIIKSSVYAALLSGTPALAKPIELWTQLNALRPDIFSVFYKFTNTFCGPRRMPWGTDFGGATNLDELNALLRKLMVRRLKTSVLSELPAKRRQLVRMDISNSSLRDVRALMNRLRGIDMSGLLNSGNFPMTQNSVNEAQSSRMEHYQILMQLYSATGMAKAEDASKWVIESLENGAQKLLVFAHHHAVLDCIESALVQSQIKIVRIDGRTPANVRHENVMQFQDSSSSIRVALLGMTSAGQGITLTAASTVVFAEMNWTPGILMQAEDRAHRIGQKNAVNIIYLRAKGTLDDIMWPLVCRKLATVGQTLDGQDMVTMQVQDVTEGTTAAVDEQILTSHASSASEAQVGTVNGSLPSTDIRNWFKKGKTEDGGSESRRLDSLKDESMPYNHSHPEEIVDLSDSRPGDCDNAERLVSQDSCEYEYVEMSPLIDLNFCDAEMAVPDNEKPDVDRVSAYESAMSEDQTTIQKDYARAKVSIQSAKRTSRSSFDQQRKTKLKPLELFSVSAMPDVYDSHPVKPSLSINYQKVPDLEEEDIEDPDGLDQTCLKEKSRVNLEDSGIFFQVSANTGRIYLYDSDKKPYDCNLSLDEAESIISGDSPNQLPVDLTHKEKAMKSLLSFVKQWRNLRAMDRKYLCGEVIRPPLVSELHRIKVQKGLDVQRKKY